MKKLTTEEFIKRAKEKHGDKYDYSKAEYINNRTKICIICPTHGEFWQTAGSHILGNGCSKCGGSEVLTNSQFISRANKVHDNFYDYKNTMYRNSSTKVIITCPIHGDFLQLPSHHLKGVGCKKCFYEHKKKLVFNIGVNDLGYSRNQTFYIKWRGMLERCYSKRSLSKNTSYSDCFVNEEWHLLSNFKQWFDKHYIDGWQLDKDILVKGNREYSPYKCCFVPQEINELFTKRKNRGHPVGVCVRNGRYIAQLRDTHLGVFNSQEEAFFAYKEAKEKRIKEIADKWKDKIEPRVYEAMYNYKVEITD